MSGKYIVLVKWDDYETSDYVFNYLEDAAELFDEIKSAGYLCYLVEILEATE